MKKKRGIEISGAEKKWFERTMRWLQKQTQFEKIRSSGHRTTEQDLRAARLALRQAAGLTRIIEKVGHKKFREWVGPEKVRQLREMGKESTSRRKVQ